MANLARMDLWKAINIYTRTCGGDPSANVHGNTLRQLAVTAIEQAVDRLVDAGHETGRERERAEYAARAAQAILADRDGTV